MLTALPGSSPLLTTAPSPNARPNAAPNAALSASATAKTAARAHASNPTGPEAGARAAPLRGGFSRTLQQAAASDPSQNGVPAGSADPAPAAEGGAPTDRPARSHSAAKINQNRAATAARVERAQGATAQPHTGAAKDTVSALDDSTSGLEPNTEFTAHEAASANDAAQAAGAVGALLGQLQAAASAMTHHTHRIQDTTQADGSTAAAPTKQAHAGRRGTAPIDPEGAGARKGSIGFGGESSHLPSRIGKNEPLTSAAARDALSSTHSASTPALQTPLAEQTGGAALVSDRRSALGAEPWPTQLNALAGVSLHSAHGWVGSAEPSSAAGEARLSASPGSPEFGPQLGAQITTFVRDGLELARLQLHPADMGPVLVQIQLDGLTAQVHLSAEHAVTRQALEDALPQLASQLREAGLTLSGGGVSEQAQQGRQAPSDKPSDRSSTSDPTGDSGASAQELRQPLTRRGVVDLVA